MTQKKNNKSHAFYLLNGALSKYSHHDASDPIQLHPLQPHVSKHPEAYATETETP